MTAPSHVLNSRVCSYVCVLVGHLLHDLYPLTVPEFCRPSRCTGNQMCGHLTTVFTSTSSKGSSAVLMLRGLFFCVYANIEEVPSASMLLGEAIHKWWTLCKRILFENRKPPFVWIQVVYIKMTTKGNKLFPGLWNRSWIHLKIKMVSDWQSCGFVSL